MEGGRMYSPKIKESLIPRIYRLAKERGVKMTVWVNGVLEKALAEQEAHDDHKVQSR